MRWSSSFSRILLCLVCLEAWASEVLASGGIDQFATPLEKVAGTITGPAGRWISIAAMAACGLTYVFNKDDLSGGFKMLIGVVFGISFIAFAAGIVDTLFSFSGAVI